MSDSLRFLVDEDLPRLLTRTVAEGGFEVEDGRDVGLRGKTDAEVFEYAVKNGLTILTGDRGFGSTIRFVLGSHHGIIVLRYPDEMPLTDMTLAVVAQLKGLEPSEVRGSVVVLDPRRVRIRARRRGTE